MEYFAQFQWWHVPIGLLLLVVLFGKRKSRVGVSRLTADRSIQDTRFKALMTCVLLLASILCSLAMAEPGQMRLFAVEIKVGPNWDATKAPHEQAMFKQHSATLRQLREAGHITMGARYADIGLLVFVARSADAVNALMDTDPAMQAGTLRYAVHAMNVFYPGLVDPGQNDPVQED
ncbi:MAG: hypothetical protein HKN50_03955 [Gammaproteobacteria bacterium]|nr:hypothetical protein [Gammaproteobacteria bacterium]